MTRRRVAAEEMELWETVIRDAKPLHSTRQPPSPKVSSVSASALERANHDTKPKKTFEISKNAAPLRSSVHTPQVRDDVKHPSLNMDFKTYKKMRKGKMRPEGRLDLHGMSLIEAHGALTHFIMAAHTARKRLVLVITGKGRKRDSGGPIPERTGVLRQEVPRWLSLSPLASCVQQVASASQSHGGAGACYVYLRKHNRKGSVSN